MGGFVQAYYDANGFSYEPGVAGYYTRDQVPVFDFLAQNFGICDRWFAPIPTSTQPNRLMALAGYTTIDATGNYPMPDHKLVYDWLVGKATWRVYSESHPFIMIMERWTLRTEFDKDRFRSLDRLSSDVLSGDLPNVIFVEPTYSDDFPRPENPSDQHWPCSIKAGEMFMKRVYDSLFCGADQSRLIYGTTASCSSPMTSMAAMRITSHRCRSRRPSPMELDTHRSRQPASGFQRW